MNGKILVSLGVVSVVGILTLVGLCLRGVNRV